MFDFSDILNLPLIWGILIATAVFLYVLLDGFDLGIGILFPFAPSDECRDKMMNSIAPFWDGNETWLILGGGGLFVAFPLAYSILLPAFYIPIIFMLLGLIMRGVAFEFRFKSDDNHRYFWDYVFHFGSLLAAFCQGMILGNFVQGVEIEGRNFTGELFHWANGFSFISGIAVIFGYALLGSTWLIMKTDNLTQNWARKSGRYALLYVGIFMSIVSIAMPIINKHVLDRWFSIPNLYYLFPIPIITVCCFILLFLDIKNPDREYRPFFLSIAIFALGYIGLAISIYPWIIPYKYTLAEAAASGPGLSLVLIGVVPLLPLILFYTGYCYYVFRGKTTHEKIY